MPNWSGAGQGALGGFTTGSTFGPVGGAIGAGIGGLIGMFSKKKPKSATGPSGNMDEHGRIMSGYENFAKTGGMSPQDEANMRARSMSPIRSIYSGARRDVNRQSALQGGYSPNKTAALAKMAREQSQAGAEATTDVEAELGNMRRQGQLAGLGGMAQTYQTRLSNPSEYARKLSSIGGTMDVIGKAGQGLGMGGSIVDAFKKKPSGGGGGGGILPSRRTSATSYGAPGL